MMNMQLLKTAHTEALDLLNRSGFELAPHERAEFAVNDFSLGNVRSEGMVMVDLHRDEKIRITLIALLPNQTLPEHLHPPYDEEVGKTEVMRVMWGEAKVYVPGPPCGRSILIPKGKEAYYTARHEVRLQPGEQYAIPPNTWHWFQAGPEGAVTMTFQNRVDETRNLFRDPQSSGCPIKITD